MKDRKYHIIRRSLLLLWLLAAAFVVRGQRLAEWVEAGDTSFAQKDYYAALKYYEAALAYDSAHVKSWYYRGLSSLAFNDYQTALKSLDRVLELDEEMNYPEVVFWMGNAHHTIGDFEKAIEHYERFLDNPGDSSAEVVDRARKFLSDCRWAIRNLPRREGQPTPQNLGPVVNSGDSDFGAIYQGDKLLYSSFRFPFPEDTRKPKRNLIQMMEYTRGSTEATRSSLGLNNPTRHTAYNTFSADQETVYYCQCDFVNAADIRCEIYFSKKDSLGLWSPGARLSVNDSMATNTQPAVGLDMETGQEILYFVSDREGTKGGLDIWYGAIEANGDVLEATNFEQVNTKYNDVSPFYHVLSQQLLFSSEGGNSMGGYDVFFSNYGQQGWGDPENLGPWVNTSYNEVHYALNENGTKAIFDSDRDGSLKYADQEEACCYDLYEVDLYDKLELEVYTFSQLDSTPLTGVEVNLDLLRDDDLTPAQRALAEVIGDGNFTVVESEERTDERGHRYVFEIERNTFYQVGGEKFCFISDSAFVNTFSLDPEVRTIRKDLYLNPRDINLTVRTIDEDDGTDLYGCNVKIYEFITPGDSILRFDETREFSNIFTYLIEQPKSKYFIQASKPGHETRSVYLTPEVIAEYCENIVVTIPLPRVDFSDFLPLSLYFDNAIPYSRTFEETTDDVYDDLAREYAEQDSLFYAKFAEGLEESKKFLAERYYEIFFTREIIGGLDNLDKFARKLLVYLQKGNELTIELRGYTSPIAHARYNRKLGLRRISSIENYFNTVSDGVLRRYIENGQLRIREVNHGEGRVGMDIPDKIKAVLTDFSTNITNKSIDNSRDRRMAVYSLMACIERRVEIVEVKANEN